MINGVNRNNSPMESLIILDRKGIIQWASPAIFDLLGYLSEELQGTEIFKIFKTYSSKTKQLYTQVQKHPTLINEGLRQFQSKNGENIPLYITVSSLPAQNMEDLVLLHLQKFRQDESGNLSLLRERAEIELTIQKKRAREIASELHDHVNPNLVAAKLLLDFSLKDPVHYLVQLKKASEIISELIQEIRSLSHTVIKKTESDFELREALNSLLENFKTGSSVRIVLRYDQGLENNLSHKQKIHVIRIIQEQLLNIIKHASATKILVSLQQMNGRVTVVTKDNGNGFDSSNHRNGIGITNMLLRVNELGGNMHINSKYNEGTSIRIILPVKATIIPDFN